MLGIQVYLHTNSQATITIDHKKQDIAVPRNTNSGTMGTAAEASRFFRSVFT